MKFKIGDVMSTVNLQTARFKFCQYQKSITKLSLLYTVCGYMMSQGEPRTSLKMYAYLFLILNRWLRRSPLGRSSSTIITWKRTEKVWSDITHDKETRIPQTHWFSFSDYSIKLDDIGVRELSHDGRLLEELDLIFLASFFFECLHRYVHFFLWTWFHPFSLLDLSELSRANQICYPVGSDINNWL